MNHPAKLVFIILAFISLVLGTGKSPYLFETIDITDGLSQNSAMTIIKDKYGFIWIGTEDGLDRYDGTAFKSFRHNPQDHTSINSNSIMCSLTDKNGDLWIGTYASRLSRYDYETESFLHYPEHFTDDLSLGEGSIFALCEDLDGYIWVGTEQAGLFRLNPLTGTIQPLKDLIKNNVSLNSVQVLSLFEDHLGQLWIGTDGGLNVLDLQSFELKSFKHDSEIAESLFDNNVNLIYETFDGHNNRLWIGTSWGGLDLYDRRSNQFIHHGFGSVINPGYPETGASTMIQESSDKIWVGTDSEGILVLNSQGVLIDQIDRKVYDKTALKDDIILYLYDDGDIIWVGTSGGGVSKFARNRKKFFNLTYDPLNPEGLHDNRILRIREDSKGRLWLATWSEGLSLFNPEDQSFKVFKHDPDDPGSISDNSIQDIFVDRHDNLWVCSSSIVLDVLRPGAAAFEHIEPNPEQEGWLQSDYILVFAEDKDGFLWLGSWGAGLIKLNPILMQFETIKEPSVNGLNMEDFSFLSIFMDSKGMMWSGAENEGLLRYDPKTQDLQQFKSSANNPQGLPNNDVMAIHEDNDGYLWIATYGGGLSKFNPRTKTFQNYGKAHGLLNESIYAIFEDKNGFLWMSTNNGLARFDRESESFHNYGLADGIVSKEFNPAACMDHDGLMYFGGVGGITWFDPTQIEENENIPPIQFTDLSIMNTEIHVGELYKGRYVLQKAITEASEITLLPGDLFFSISFASLDYYHPPSNMYAYYLEGFNNKWRYSGHQNKVTFTNLPAGDFTLHVKGSNNDGVWNEAGTSIKIMVLPQFYESWWFIIAVAMIGLLAFTMLFRLRTSYLVRRSTELERHNIQLNAQVNSRREAHKRARVRADYFRAVITQSPTPMAIHDTEGNITHLNKGWEKLWAAKSTDDIIRDYNVDTDPLAKQLNLGKHFKAALTGRIIEAPEVEFVAPDGTNHVAHILVYPLKGEQGSTNHVMISMDDITEVVQHRNLLEKSINDKELLIKEVHHRVKNNLQIIASLLGLQKAGLDDPKTIQTLDEFRNRVNSMALVHDALYRSQELDNIDIATYVRGLNRELQSAFEQPIEPVSIVTDVEQINLSVDIAVPCGLLINELVTNALKYAFPDPKQKGKQIAVRISTLDKERIRLEVSDNGIGIPKPVVWDSVHSLGLYLVKILSENQLMGSIILNNGDEGAQFIIEFPLYPDYDRENNP